MGIRIRSELFLQVKGTLPCKIHDNNTIIHSQPVHLGREQNRDYLLLFKLSVSPQSIWICSVKIEISEIYTGLKFPREPMFPLSERKCVSSVVFLLLSLSVLWLASWLCLSLYAWSDDRKKRAARRNKKEGLERTGEIQKGWRDSDWLTEEAGEKGRNLSREADSHRRSCSEEPFTHPCAHGHTHRPLPAGGMASDCP